MKRIPIFQVDAFADRPFEGNPAAVCLLDEWLPARVLQAIAEENNLPETAFLGPTCPDDSGSRYHIRWFTPRVEVDLCGHATLAAAWVVFHRLNAPYLELRLQSASGLLTVNRDDRRLTLDFPQDTLETYELPPWVVAALGVQPVTSFRGRDVLVVVRTQSEVETLEPDLAALSKLKSRGVIVTAPGDTVDFVSRFFAPAAGIPEDPVTGSAHCALTPYWAGILGRRRLKARQVSRRGGDLDCEWIGDRVLISGRATLVLEGELFIPDELFQ